MTFKRFLPGFLAVLLCAASAWAISPDDVRASGSAYQGKIASVLMPQGWQKGTFDSPSWLDLVAPGDSRARATIRFEKKNMYSRSEKEFMDKFQAQAKKDGAKKIQRTRVGNVPFFFYIVPSPRKRPLRDGTVFYDMQMGSDWPRKSGTFRDAMLISITGRPLMGNWNPEQAGELLHKGILPDAAVMAILQSVSFNDAPVTTSLAPNSPVYNDGGSASGADPAIEKAIQTGRLAGIWQPVMLKLAGQDLYGEAMDAAASAKKRTFIFDADGTFSYEPKNFTWSAKEGQKSAYNFGDLSGKIWYEAGQLHFQDGEGYHFVYDKVPNPNPSDAELLAGTIGEWKPVEIIDADKDVMGDELKFAALRNSFKLENLVIRPDGKIESERRRGTWKIENGQVAFDFFDENLRAYPGRLEAVNGKGARLIYVPADRADKHRSVYQAEFDEREREAAKEEPVIGLWIPFAAESGDGRETAGDQFARTYESMALKLQIVSDGTVRLDGKIQGSWHNDGGTYAFDMTSGRYKGKAITFENGTLRLAYTDFTTFKYVKKR